jgi:hypothetical protein
VNIHAVGQVTNKIFTAFTRILSTWLITDALVIAGTLVGLRGNQSPARLG